MLTHSLLDCPMPRMVEAIIGSLLRLHNDPATRSEAGVCLEAVAAPFTEFRYIHDDPQLPEVTAETDKDGRAAAVAAGHPALSRTGEADREMRFMCGKFSLLSLASSWTGVGIITRKRRPDERSALHSLVETLYLPNARIRVSTVMYNTLKYLHTSIYKYLHLHVCTCVQIKNMHA